MLKNITTHPRFFKNLSTLFIAQGGLYVFHLITLPYVTRILGPESYGTMSYVLAFVGCLILLTEWGFGYYGVKEIVKLGDKLKECSQIFWSILLTKLLIALFGFIFLCIYLIVNPKFVELYFIAFIGVLSSIFSPGYYYQALQHNSPFTFIMLIVRLLCIGLTYLLITDRNDINFAILILSGGNLIISILGLLHLLKTKKLFFIESIRFDIPKILKSALPFVFVTATQQIYLNLVILLIGVFSDKSEVGYFSAAYFFLRFLITFQQPITQAIFPKSVMTLLTYESSFDGLRKVFFYGLVLSILVSLSLFFCADYLILMMYGDQFFKAANLIKILSLMPISIFLNNFFGVYLLLSAGFEKQYTSLILGGTILGLTLTLFLSINFGSVGAAFGVFFTESMIAALMMVGAYVLIPRIQQIFK